MKGWSDVFQTGKRDEVEKELKEQGMDYRWGKNNSLHIYNKVEAVEKHPDTGDTIWFNHLMVSDISGFKDTSVFSAEYFGMTWSEAIYLSCLTSVLL